MLKSETECFRIFFYTFNARSSCRHCIAIYFLFTLSFKSSKHHIVLRKYVKIFIRFASKKVQRFLSQQWANVITRKYNIGENFHAGRYLFFFLSFVRAMDVTEFLDLRIIDNQKHSKMDFPCIKNIFNWFSCGLKVPSQMKIDKDEKKRTPNDIHISFSRKPVPNILQKLVWKFFKSQLAAYRW